jgi:hypothetical protein
VIITLEDYRKRFVDVEADRLRAEMVERIKQADPQDPEGRLFARSAAEDPRRVSQHVHPQRLIALLRAGRPT